MDVAAVVMQKIMLMRINNCKHENWSEVAPDQNPQPGELQCQGCGVIATPEARERLKSK